MVPYHKTTMAFLVCVLRQSLFHRIEKKLVGRFSDDVHTDVHTEDSSVEIVFCKQR